MADFSKLFEKMQSVEPAREERSYIKIPGKHTATILTVENRESQQGKELVIIEYQVTDSDGYAAGDGLKQIFALSNEQSWRIEQNLGLIRALINSAIPGVSLNQELFENSISGGPQSALAGKSVTIIATEKLPQKDKLVSLSNEQAGMVLTEDVGNLSEKTKLTESNIAALLKEGVTSARVVKPYISFSYRAAQHAAVPPAVPTAQVETDIDEDDVPFDI
jgi:hypothetical protein